MIRALVGEARALLVRARGPLMVTKPAASVRATSRQGAPRLVAHVWGVYAIFRKTRPPSEHS